MVNESTNWVITIFASLLAIGIAYTIARIIIASISPGTNDQIEQFFITRDAKWHFRFLLEKGYKISQVNYVNHYLAGWHFQIESPDSEILITLDQQEGTLLTLGREPGDKPYQILLEAMIYYLSAKKDFIGYPDKELTLSRSQRFAKTAKFLKRYINQIEGYVRNDFEKSKTELSNIQEEYVAVLIQGTQRGTEHRK